MVPHLKLDGCYSFVPDVGMVMTNVEKLIWWPVSCSASNCRWTNK